MEKSKRSTTDSNLAIKAQFVEVSGIIAKGRKTAFTALNAAVISTYWSVGEYISNKIKTAEWGDGVVRQLADFLEIAHPEQKGFSDKNLWRMKQFFETYSNDTILSPLVREIGWTQNIIILSKCKTDLEREFYLRESVRNNYSKRELERQISSGSFERSLIQPKLSQVLNDIHPESVTIFRDSYTLDFLGLPSQYNESDLQKGIIHSLKQFIIEFGRDFAFIGEEYRIQVGMKDYFIDLLFYHRELQCLVAFELKVDEFKPEYMGKLSFYLEALDRDVKKMHENPSIGIILCKGRDSEVVEYALARTTSPAVIAEYTTKLPDKKLLQAKLHEFFGSTVHEMQAEYNSI